MQFQILMAICTSYTVDRKLRIVIGASVVWSQQMSLLLWRRWMLTCAWKTQTYICATPRHTHTHTHTHVIKEDQGCSLILKVYSRCLSHWCESACICSVHICFNSKPSDSHKLTVKTYASILEQEIDVQKGKIVFLRLCGSSAFSSQEKIIVICGRAGFVRNVSEPTTVNAHS